MTDRPSYLGLLNAISLAEGEAECYLSAWADATSRDDVRSILRTIALREGEHSKAFAKRMCELGFDVRPRGESGLDERMRIASSTTLSDLEKFQQLDLGRPPLEGKPDVFAPMLNDTTIDIQTGELLGRYIAEERDSGRMFQACRSQLEAECATTNGSANGSTGSATTSTDDRLARIEALLEKLVDQLAAKA